MDKLRKAQRQGHTENHQFQRQVNRSQQLIDNQERKLVAELKVAAKRGDKSSCTILAKQIHSLQCQRRRNLGLSAHMNALQTKQDSLVSTVKLGGTIQSMTQCAEKVNKHMDSMNLPKTLGKFQKEQDKFEMSEELMDDCLSSLWDEVDDQTVDDEVAKVLDSLAIDIGQAMPSVPSGSLSSSTPNTNLTAKSNLMDKNARHLAK